MSKSNLLTSLLVSELKELGVKHKGKKVKMPQGKCKQLVFRQALHLLQLTDAFLANGTVVQVPKFIAETCSTILENVEVEGIFRKAGSAIKQREIRKCLEDGIPLGKTHGVIDIANILSYFFRELPEPLIPTYVHETLVRCLGIDESNRFRAMQLACLLPPALTVHTLAYFMQFLHTVSAHADMNKMSAENLAIVLAPSVMPHADFNSVQFRKHIKLVQLLIQNANLIGTIPVHISDMLQNTNTQLPCTVEPSQTPQRHDDNGSTQGKKKRRSEMFNGIRKIVGSAIGSSENLDYSKPAIVRNTEALPTKQRSKLMGSATSSHKRKFADPVDEFSTKKRKDTMVGSSYSTSGLLQIFPQNRVKTHSRISFGGNQSVKKACVNSTALSAMERRWSLANTGWPKHKNKDEISNKNSHAVEKIIENKFRKVQKMSVKKDLVDFKSSDNIRISDDKYESIKQRAIEAQISQEFDDMQNAVLESSLTTNSCHLFSGPESVQNKYNKIVKETEALKCQATEQLAQRLSKGLKIRRSIEQQVIRSPSARKIGTLRRRSQERARVTRTKTWHSSGSSLQNPHATDATLTNSCTLKNNLKRERSKPMEIACVTPIPERSRLKKETEHEQWIPAETFFENAVNRGDYTKDLGGPYRSQIRNSPMYKSVLCTPNINMKAGSMLPENLLTPMLPPKSVPRKHILLRTPNSQRKPSINHLLASAPSDNENGRASIARLRTQNAGMVLAKTKLFDGLSNCIDGNTELKDSTESHVDRTPTKPTQNIQSCSQKEFTQRDLPNCLWKRTTTSNQTQSGLKENRNENISIPIKLNKHIGPIMKPLKEAAHKSAKSERALNRQIQFNSPRKLNHMNLEHRINLHDRNSLNFSKAKNWK